MTNRPAKILEWTGPAVDTRSLKPLEFEMALDLGGGAGRKVVEVVRAAAESVGGELLFVLPARGPDATVVDHAVVCLDDDGRKRFLQVRAEGSAFVVAQEPAMQPDLLRFARTSVTLFAQLRAARRRAEANADQA